MHSIIKFLCEIVPLAVFFICYKYLGLLPATAALVVATMVAIPVLYTLERKIPMVPLFSALLLTFFGALTLFSGNPVFIKIKPTIINSLFAAILLGGVWCNKGLLKHIAGNAMPLTDEGWIKFSFRWGMFFLCLAVLNEVIWRNFPEAFWVKFKVFGMLPLTLIFTAFQFPLIKKYSKTEVD
jgi:intracellular septation protein